MTRRPGRGRAIAPRRATDRGAVTAELALGLPLLLAVAASLVWLLAVGAAQVRTIDAAREAARAAARGDDDAAAIAGATRVAPAGSTVTLTRVDGRVVATVTASVDGPGGLLGSLPGATVRAEAVARDEEAP